MAADEEPLKILIDETQIEAVVGANTTVQVTPYMEQPMSVVVIRAHSRVNGTNVNIPVELIMNAPKARLIAQRLFECAYVAEKAATRGEP